MGGEEEEEEEEEDVVLHVCPSTRWQPDCM